jgi:glycosyltransferase involved in cell wall biosynthesis
LDHLILASSFNRFAGPNNNLLDVCNYMHDRLGVDLVVLTNICEIDSQFLKAVRFPLVSVLKGRPADPLSRLVHSPTNVALLRKFMGAYRLGSKNLFVNSSIDTLFEASLATAGSVKTGHNVINTGFVTPGTNLFLGGLDRIAARSAIGRIMATTPYQKRIYRDLGIPEQAIAIIPSCVDMNLVYSHLNSDKTITEPADDPIIFYGGRIEQEKGIRELMLAYEQVVKSTRATLRLVGDGPLRTWVLQTKERIERQSSNARIIFSASWQPREYVLREMWRADIVVLPSYHEMCPVALIEAMCLRKAVVCTRVGGPREMITNARDGMLVNPLRVDELASAILNLVADQSLRTALGSQAFETFKREYEVSVVAPKFKDFLEGC